MFSWISILTQFGYDYAGWNLSFLQILCSASKTIISIPLLCFKEWFLKWERHASVLEFDSPMFGSSLYPLIGVWIWLLLTLSQAQLCMTIQRRMTISLLQGYLDGRVLKVFVKYLAHSWSLLWKRSVLTFPKCSMLWLR